MTNNLSANRQTNNIFRHASQIAIDIVQDNNIKVTKKVFWLKYPDDDPNNNGNINSNANINIDNNHSSNTTTSSSTFGTVGINRPTK